MTMISGFVAAVPTANRDAYIRYASEAATYFKEHGALHVMEAWGTDVPDGKVNSMNTAVMRKDDETVVFAWIVWPDAATANAAMAAMMEEPRFDTKTNPMPLDGMRMIFGSFEPIVDV